MRGPGVPSPADLPGLPQALRAHLLPGIREELAPFAALCARVGSPQLQTPTVLVGGTNGKGSTTCQLAAILQAAGLRVGLFQSPPMGGFAHHMSVDGAPPSADELEQLARSLRPHAHPPATPFEWATLLAFRWFVDRSVELAVVEVGLGGREDATNAAQPLLSVVTQIERDHCAILGPTVGDIARVKGGIARSGRPLLTAAEGEGLAALERAAADRGAVVEVLGRDFHASGRWDQAHLPGLDLPVALGMSGAHQVKNAALAARAVEHLRALGFSIPPQSVREGLRRARLAGRLEKLGEDPPLYFDGAHNPSGARALAAAAREMGLTPYHLVLGAYSDKEVEEMALHLAPDAASITLVSCPPPRGLSAAELDRRLRAVGVVADRQLDLETAVRARPPGAPTLVAGSLSLWNTTRAATSQAGGSR